MLKKHVWITMVLMASFFVCIKMTLLFFYKRLFLITNVRPPSITPGILFRINTSDGILTRCP